MDNLQEIPSGRLLQEYRDIMLALGTRRDDATLSRKADLYEQEIARRMSW